MPMVKECTDTEQRCSACKAMKPFEDFYRDRHMKNGLSPRCKSCQRAADLAYQTTDKYRRKVRRTLWRRQGIDITCERYEEMLAAQGGACSICERTENQFGKGMCVDHDHTTGLVRGILCTDCNMGIGNLKDDIALLRRAVAYLEGSMERTVV